MAFIKTTNMVVDKVVQHDIRTVQCPYCKTFLEGISLSTTAMFCWHCRKEFRIQQDKWKFINDLPKGMKRTVLFKGKV